MNINKVITVLVIIFITQIQAEEVHCKNFQEIKTPIKVFLLTIILMLGLSITIYIDNYINNKPWTVKTIQDMLLRDSVNLNFVNGLSGYIYLILVFSISNLNDNIYRTQRCLARFNAFCVLLSWILSQSTLLFRKLRPQWDDALNQFEENDTEGLKKYRKIIGSISTFLITVIVLNGQVTPSYDKIPQYSLLIEFLLMILVLFVFLVNIIIDKKNLKKLAEMQSTISSNISLNDVENGDLRNQPKDVSNIMDTRAFWMFLMIMIPSAIVGMITSKTFGSETKAQIAENASINLIVSGLLTPLVICLISPKLGQDVKKLINCKCKTNIIEVYE